MQTQGQNYGMALRRRRRLAKWSGVAICLCLLLAWLTSGPWGCYVTYAKVDRTNPAKWDLHPIPNEPEVTYSLPEFALCLAQGSASLAYRFRHIVAEKPGWNVHQLAGSRDWRVWGTGRPIQWLPGCTTNGVCTSVDVPLWIPLLIVLAATGHLFWRDRRRIAPHCCQACGYNLTGNTSGMCPECGQPVGQDTPAT